jgi:hypothetical protein
MTRNILCNMALAAVMDTGRSLPIMDETHPASDEALLAAPDRGPTFGGIG